MVEATEAGTSTGSRQAARNWLDGIYGEKTTSIKYPTFQPVTYSMNYINKNDTYNISRALTDSGNIYGLNSSTTDSHLMKNSEWGATAYLSWSEYGTNKTESYINNITLNSGDRERTETSGKIGVDSVYAVTGLTSGSQTEEKQQKSESDIKSLNNRTGNNATNGIYAWDQTEGQKASSTLNMYGVYDLSGGLWEGTSGYINNGDSNLTVFGANMVVNGNVSTKYATVYPYKSPESSSSSKPGEDNYKENKYIFGDAIRETSTGGGSTNSSWNDDYSYFHALYNPFSVRGGDYTNNIYAGMFYFHRTSGDSTTAGGFRPVLIAI